MVKPRALRTSEEKGFACGMGSRQLLPKRGSLIPCFHKDARKRKQTQGWGGLKTSMGTISSPLPHRGLSRQEELAGLTPFRGSPLSSLTKLSRCDEGLTVLAESLGYLC